MKRQSWLMLGVVLACVAGTAGYLKYLKGHQRLGRPGVKVGPVTVFDPDGKVVGTSSVMLPEKVLDYDSKAVPISHIVLGWLPKDTVYGQRTYQAADGFEMQMSVVLMGTDRTSIHKPQYCLTGAGWQITGSEGLNVPIGSPHPYDLPVTRLLSTHTRSFRETGDTKPRGIFVYWFVADDQITADHNQRMWWMARDMIRTGVLQRWSYVTLFSVCLPGQEEATYERMKGFIAAAVPTFQLATRPAPALARYP